MPITAGVERDVFSATITTAVLLGAKFAVPATAHQPQDFPSTRVLGRRILLRPGTITTHAANHAVDAGGSSRPFLSCSVRGDGPWSLSSYKSPPMLNGNGVNKRS